MASRKQLSENGMTEAEEQTELFSWIRLFEPQFPVLGLIYHTPNGEKRDKATAGRLKAMGVRAGVPDICVPVARHNRHGLYIEMKVGTNKPTEVQKKFMRLLMSEGYAVRVAYSHEQAREMIVNYLNLPEYTKGVCWEKLKG